VRDPAGWPGLRDGQRDRLEYRGIGREGRRPSSTLLDLSSKLAATTKPGRGQTAQQGPSPRSRGSPCSCCSNRRFETVIIALFNSVVETDTSGAIMAMCAALPSRSPLRPQQDGDAPTGMAVAGSARQRQRDPRLLPLCSRTSFRRAELLHPTRPIIPLSGGRDSSDAPRAAVQSKRLWHVLPGKHGSQQPAPRRRAAVRVGLIVVSWSLRGMLPVPSRSQVGASCPGASRWSRQAGDRVGCAGDDKGAADVARRRHGGRDASPSSPLALPPACHPLLDPPRRPSSLPLARTPVPAAPLLSDTGFLLSCSRPNGQPASGDAGPPADAHHQDGREVQRGHEGAQRSPGGAFPFP
jgi:hypothetical protein